ncbi:MAG: Acetolactate synthase large subunit, partial [uncultured Blastococcus sp.]
GRPDREHDRSAVARPIAGERRRGGRLRHPRRRDPAGLRPAVRLEDAAPHPGAPRAGRRPRGRGLRAGDRSRRRLHGHQRPRCDQPRHADRRRLHGLGAAGGHHRAGPERGHRHRRLPGGRHRRHHDADHQAQLPGAVGRRHPAHHRRGLPHREHGPAWSRPRRPPEGHPAGDRHLRLAAHARPAGLPPHDPAARQAGARGRPARGRGAAAGALRRRRRPQGPRGRRAADPRRADRHPRRHDPHGPWRLPRQPPAAHRHARHARHGRCGHRAAEVRPAHHPRRPLRRPGDRQARQLRAGRQGHPRRHRPGGDRQEPAGRRPDRGGLPRDHRRPRRRGAGAVRRRHPRRPHRLVAAGQRLARDLPARLRRADRRLARPAVRHLAHRPADRTRGHLRQRRRPAPDVGQPVHLLREPLHLAELRRPRHHGLLGAGGDGREGRPARHHGLGDRRRRLLPDDQPGARHLLDRGHPDQGRRHQQRQPRHGAAVADPVLRGPLLQHEPAVQAHPRLRQARRRHGLRRTAVRRRCRRRRDDREGDGGRRHARGGRLPRRHRRHGVADGACRHEQRRDPRRPRHAAGVGRERRL